MGALHFPFERIRFTVRTTRMPITPQPLKANVGYLLPWLNHGVMRPSSTWSSVRYDPVW